ncbi:hypothetical protein ABPG75_011111 [Micractinium tetrahymenae]
MMAAVACTTTGSARILPGAPALAEPCRLQRPSSRRRCSRTSVAAGGANGSHSQQQQQQQPVLDELVLALMQRRAQQGKPPLAQVPSPSPVPAAGSNQAVAPEQPQHEEDLAAGLSAGAAQLVDGVAATAPSVVQPGPAPAATLALAAYEDAMAQRPLASVRFSLRLHAQPGQRVRVVGSGDELGKWDAMAAPELRYTDGDLWQATLQLPTGCIVEYKYVILDGSGRNVLAWQDGNNNVLAVRLADESLEVADNWNGDMRGQVVSAGGAAETRESRLLAWAGDLFAQLSTQRAELRQSRLELAGAKEGEQEARAEAQYFKAQSKTKEAERAEAVAALAEVQALNRAMEHQLADTTQALLEAIDTADALLTAAEDGEDARAAEEAAPEVVAAEQAVPQAVAAEEQPAPRRGRRSAAPAAPAAAASAAPRRGRPRKAVAAAASVTADEPAIDGAAAASVAAAVPKQRRRRATKAEFAE